MKTLLLLTALIAGSAFAGEGSWNDSPSNWNNNDANWANSSSNWNNNPSNWQNSSSNFNSTNGIYDNSGNRTGYSVDKPDGGTNYYTNEGYRYGYHSAHE